jgi:hypothetical protein
MELLRLWGEPVEAEDEKGLSQTPSQASNGKEVIERSTDPTNGGQSDAYHHHLVLHGDQMRRP